MLIQDYDDDDDDDRYKVYLFISEKVSPISNLHVPENYKDLKAKFHIRSQLERFKFQRTNERFNELW